MAHCGREKRRRQEEEEVKEVEPRRRQERSDSTGHTVSFGVSA